MVEHPGAAEMGPSELVPSRERSVDADRYVLSGDGTPSFGAADLERLRAAASRLGARLSIADFHGTNFGR